MYLIKLAIALGVAGALATAATPASAVLSPFASISPVDGAYPNTVFYPTGAGGQARADSALTTVSIDGTDETLTIQFPATTLVYFSFFDMPISKYVHDVGAYLTFYAIINNQNDVEGAFSLRSASAINLPAPDFAGETYAAGANLLSGTFYAGNVPSSGPLGLVADLRMKDSDVVFSSDFISFAPTTEIEQFFEIGVQFFDGLEAGSLGGEFLSEPAPQIDGLSAVPEPGVWMLMITGFGVVGTSMRRRGSRLSN